MTKPKPLPTIARCPSGHKPRLEPFASGRFFVECYYGLLCWSGPVRKSRRGAINAWNRVMNAAHAASHQGE